MRLPGYQINEIKKDVVFFSICPMRFSNLPGFNRPFLPVENGRIAVESLFRKPVKASGDNNIPGESEKTWGRLADCHVALSHSIIVN